MSHNTVIKARISGLQNLSNMALERISPEILFNGASKVKSSLSDENYAKYVSLFGSEPISSVELQNYTDDEKFLIDLETAEAYYCLYYLAIALKQLQDNNIGITHAGGSSGNVTFNEFDNIVKSMNIYISNAKEILVKYLSSTGKSSWIAV